MWCNQSGTKSSEFPSFPLIIVHCEFGGGFSRHAAGEKLRPVPERSDLFSHCNTDGAGMVVNN